MPYEVTRRFEHALCEYTGAPYAVAVNSCTAALLLAVAWHLRDRRAWSLAGEPMLITGNHPLWQVIEIPKRTYASVPMSIIHAGARPTFRDEDWHGVYQLKPLPVWDCARRFTSGMYIKGQFQCVSFSTTKILGSEQGGAILHNSPEADPWLRKMRFDGRTEDIDQREDTFTLAGYHCIMLPSTAATLTLKLYHLPKHNPDLPDYPYPDLSLHPAFQTTIRPLATENEKKHG